MCEKEPCRLIRDEREKWEREISGSIAKLPEAREKVTTSSGIPIKWIYTPEDLEDLDYLRDLNFPGHYPYTRGVHLTMHRGQPWSMRVVTGFSKTEATNERIRSLLERGERGLSLVFDMPTLNGYDPDHPFVEGEVGGQGMSVCCLQDMEAAFGGVPIDKIAVVLNTCSAAPILMAMYIALAEKRGLNLAQIQGTIQNEVLKEYETVSMGYWLAPERAFQMALDLIKYLIQHLPRFNFISFNGHGIRENGLTAVQEIAFCIINAKTYIRALIEDGLDVDAFAPRLSFFWGADNNFFEEVAKYRAARRLWAKIMRGEFKAKNPRSWMMRAGVMTCGSNLFAQEPQNNIARVTLQALAAVLGGNQTLNACCMDEALGIPTDEAALIALRTQQIIAYESMVTNTIDPLAGSYFVESLTNELEGKIAEYVQNIERQGGVFACIKNGFFDAEVSKTSLDRYKQIETGERIVVGLNFGLGRTEQTKGNGPTIEIFEVSEEEKEKLKQRVVKHRRERDNNKVKSALERFRQALKQDQNSIPSLIEAVKVGATIGEIREAEIEVWGEYKQKPLY